MRRKTRNMTMRVALTAAVCSGCASTQPTGQIADLPEQVTLQRVDQAVRHRRSAQSLYPQFLPRSSHTHGTRLRVFRSKRGGAGRETRRNSQVIGQTVSHYTILEKLGEGGMGVVYKATDTRLHRTVALKFLPPHRAEGDRDRERFIQEARTAAGLSRPGICTIHDVVDEGENPFIAMEYVEGQTLRSLAARSPLPAKEALTFATQVAEALDAAHAKGIVHRDVKSDSIMITPNRKIQRYGSLVDFMYLLSMVLAE